MQDTWRELGRVSKGMCTEEPGVNSTACWKEKALFLRPRIQEAEPTIQFFAQCREVEKEREKARGLPAPDFSYAH